MVSSALDMELDELLRRLAQIKKTYADDAEYRKLRAALPKTWPV